MFLKNTNEKNNSTNKIRFLRINKAIGVEFDTISYNKNAFFFISLILLLLLFVIIVTAIL
jgi:succinate dehydrogenase/fumarate reductase cytochrome b subunit